MLFSYSLVKIANLRALSVQNGLHSEKECKLWIKKCYCVILCLSWEMNESLRTTVLRHKNTGVCMRMNNPILIVCFVSLY